MKLPVWFHRFGSPRWFFDWAGRARPWFGALAAMLIGVATAWGLGFAPADYQQGDSFRIIYVHVPTAYLAQSCYVAMALASAVLLIWRIKLADVFVEVSAPVGAVMTALALFSGAAWGAPTWGTWWDWDSRTTSMLLQLFLYLGLILLRRSLDGEDRAARACAVLCLVGVVNIPIIKYSVDWWQTLHQAATFTLTEKPKMPPSMYVPLLLNVLGFYFFFGAVVLGRMRVAILRRERRTQWARQWVLSTQNEAAGASTSPAQTS